jgi:hypothetical protein
VLFVSERLYLEEGQETAVRLDDHRFRPDVEFGLTDKDWSEVYRDERDDAPRRSQGWLDRPRRDRRHW